MNVGRMLPAVPLSGAALTVGTRLRQALADRGPRGLALVADQLLARNQDGANDHKLCLRQQDIANLVLPLLLHQNGKGPQDV